MCIPKTQTGCKILPPVIIEFVKKCMPHTEGFVAILMSHKLCISGSLANDEYIIMFSLTFPDPRDEIHKDNGFGLHTSVCVLKDFRKAKYRTANWSLRLKFGVFSPISQYIASAEVTSQDNLPFFMSFTANNTSKNTFVTFDFMTGFYNIVL